MKKLILVFFLLLVAPSFLWAACTGSSPTWACGATYAELDNLINQNSPAGFQDGDTINVTGTETWSSTLTIDRPLTLAGTGSYNNTTKVYTTGTKITRSGLMIDIDNNAGGINSANIRITGIHFDRVETTGADKTALYVQGGDNPATEKITNLRVDNCRFDNGRNPTIAIADIVFGVFDNNYYYNMSTGIEIGGDMSYTDIGPYIWNNYSYAAGTGDMLFFEDSYFEYDSSSTASDGIYYFSNTGARFVIRYNTFDAADCTSCTNLGITNLYTFWGWGRGTKLVEIYNNTVDFRTGITQNVFGIRGGSLLLHNNTVTAPNPNGKFVAFGSPCGDSDAWKDSQLARYPMEDQINNSFVWGNTFGGSSITIADVKNDSCQPTGDSYKRVGVQGDGSGSGHTEVWLQEPAATGGKNVYPAGLGSGNFYGADGTDVMYFTSSGANEYYGYTPYTYPHPLSGEATTTPSISGVTISDLRIDP